MITYTVTQQVVKHSNDLYLVVENYDESSYPLRIFENETEANSFAIRLARKEENCDRSFAVYRQCSYLNRGNLKRVKEYYYGMFNPISL